MCVLISSTTFVWNISHSENNSARYDQIYIYIYIYIYIGLYVKYSLLLSNSNKIWIF